jgi:hypothetical protein
MDDALAPTRSRSQTMSVVWTPAEDDLLRRTLAAFTESPSWGSLTSLFPSKTAIQIAGRWEKVLNPDLIKGSWTREEDLTIQEFVRMNGPRNWVQLALLLPGRIGKQCRERWTNHLNPEVFKGGWSREEDEKLIELRQKFGNQWTKIAGYFEGRTDNALKNRWNSTLKRQLQRIQNGEPVNRKRGRKPKTISGTELSTDENAYTRKIREKTVFPPISSFGVETEKSTLPLPFIYSGHVEIAGPTVAIPYVLSRTYGLINKQNL